MTTAVEVSRLTKAYGYRLILRDMDLSLAWGESLAIVGANGSGKSTFIKVLAGLASPTLGQIRIGGLNPKQESSRVRRLVGVVTHQHLLYPELTGYENLKFHGRLFGLSDTESRIAKLNQELGLEEYLHRQVRTLSQGMQKRLALARALLHQPPLLLLDEPETGLDQAALELLRGLLVRHQSTGGSIITTTPNTERSLGVEDQIAILWEGRIVHQAPANSLKGAQLQETYVQVTGAQR